MVVLKCPLASCSYKTDDVEVVGAAALLNIHAVEHTTPPSASTAAHARVKTKGPKLERPKIDVASNMEQWNSFWRRWSSFRTGSNIDDEDASGQLIECATDKLSHGRALKAEFHGVADR